MSPAQVNSCNAAGAEKLRVLCTPMIVGSRLKTVKPIGIERPLSRKVVFRADLSNNVGDMKTSSQAPLPQRRYKRTLKIVLVTTLAILVALFVVQNITSVEIHFMGWSVLLPVAMVMFIALAIGIVIGWFLPGILRYRKHRRMGRQ